MKNFKNINLTTGILACLFLQLGCVSLHRGTVNLLTVRADKNGNKPRDITEEFLEAARSGEYEEAKKHWTAEGIEHYETRSNLDGFKDHCDRLSRYPGYKVRVSTPSKGGRWLRVHWYDEQDRKLDEGWSFYFEKIDDQWYIVQ